MKCSNRHHLYVCSIDETEMDGFVDSESGGNDESVDEVLRASSADGGREGREDDDDVALVE